MRRGRKGKVNRQELSLSLPPTPPSPPPRTSEEVATVFLQFLGLRVQAAAAAARGRGQPFPEGLEGRSALWGTKDYDGVVLHVVEALDGRGGDIQERVLVLRQMESLR